MLNLLFSNCFLQTIRKRTVSGRISKRAPRPYPLSLIPGPPFPLRSLSPTPFYACYAGYQLCAYVRQLKNFSMDTDCIVHWSIASLKVFKENLSTNFGLIAVFVKGTLEITKRAQHCVWLIHMLSWLIEIAQVYLRLVGCRMHKGHVQNEWVIKTFRKHPKGSKFVCTKSSLHFIHNLYLLVEIQRYLESPRIDFCETPYNRIQAPKVYVA